MKRKQASELGLTRLIVNPIVTFEPSSKGQLALVIYEWNDGVFVVLRLPSHPLTPSVHAFNVTSSRRMRPPSGLTLADASLCRTLPSWLQSNTSEHQHRRSRGQHQKSAFSSA